MYSWEKLALTSLKASVGEVPKGSDDAIGWTQADEHFPEVTAQPLRCIVPTYLDFRIPTSLSQRSSLELGHA